MKAINPLKTPFGRGKFSPVKDARYRQWDDAFEVEFADGLSFLEPHKTIRNANRISSTATVVRVELDEELRHGFFVHYDNGQVAEVSWAFIREQPPRR
jgi:hypothetical protein